MVLLIYLVRSQLVLATMSTVTCVNVLHSRLQSAILRLGINLWLMCYHWEIKFCMKKTCHFTSKWCGASHREDLSDTVYELIGSLYSSQLLLYLGIWEPSAGLNLSQDPYVFKQEKHILAGCTRFPSHNCRLSR